MVKISPKREKKVKGKIRRVYKRQGRKEGIEKLTKAWKRIRKNERIPLSTFMSLVSQVEQEETYN